MTVRVFRIAADDLAGRNYTILVPARQVAIPSRRHANEMCVALPDSDERLHFEPYDESRHELLRHARLHVDCQEPISRDDFFVRQFTQDPPSLVIPITVAPVPPVPTLPIDDITCAVPLLTRDVIDKVTRCPYLVVISARSVADVDALNFDMRAVCSVCKKILHCNWKIRMDGVVNGLLCTRCAPIFTLLQWWGTLGERTDETAKQQFTNIADAIRHYVEYYVRT